MKYIKHTPGPWKVRFFRENEPDQGFFVEEKNNNDPESRYGIEILMEYFGNHNGYTTDQRMADANLISAAPDLLYALKEYVNVQQGMFSQVTTTPEERLEKALAALRKAGLIIIMILSITAKSQRIQDIPDVTKHQVAGTLISTTVSITTEKITGRPVISCLIGLAASIIAGFGKELIYDKAMGRGFCNIKGDVPPTIWGGACGSIGAGICIGLRNHKKSKHERN